MSVNERAARGCVSPWQLFAVLTVLRVTASLGEVSSLARGVPASDMLLSLLLGAVLTTVLSVPLAVCISKKKIPPISGGIGWLYALCFVLLQAFGMASFLRFSTSEVHPEAQPLVVVLMLSAACCYAAFLGVEALGRAAAVIFVLLLPVVGVAVLGNLKNITLLNYYPVLKNTRTEVWVNALLFAANSDEMLFAAVLSSRVNGRVLKPYYLSVGAAYGIIILLVGTCIGVTGYAAEAYRYPIYTLFKMASLGNLTRLDAVHTAFWILAFFLRGGVALYCAAVCLPRLKHAQKCALAAACSGVAAVLLVHLPPALAVSSGIAFKIITALILEILIPPLFLLIKRKGKAHESH